MILVIILFRDFRDTGYSPKKLPGYGIFEEKIIGIQDIEKQFQGYGIFAKNCKISDV